MQATTDERTRHIGRRVRVGGTHPWAGHLGTFIGWESTVLGEVPSVRLDDADDVPAGQTVLIMKPGDWTPLPL
jgi:hypothetical protein